MTLYCTFRGLHAYYFYVLIFKLTDVFFLDYTVPCPSISINCFRKKKYCLLNKCYQDG